MWPNLSPKYVIRNKIYIKENYLPIPKKKSPFFSSSWTRRPQIQNSNELMFIFTALNLEDNLQAGCNHLLALSINPRMTTRASRTSETKSSQWLFCKVVDNFPIESVGDVPILSDVHFIRIMQTENTTPLHSYFNSSTLVPSLQYTSLQTCSSSFITFDDA